MVVTAVIPVPLRLTVCGLLFPLSVTVSVPVRAPNTAGVKITEIVQLFPELRVEGQLFVWLKSERLVVIPLIVMEVVWPFFNVICFAALELPKARLPNERLEGDMVTFWAETGNTERTTHNRSEDHRERRESILKSEPQRLKYGTEPGRNSLGG